MRPRFDMLIVGAGHAGAQVAIALRQRKFAGSIAVIGDEPDLPYERPALSKECLAGEKSFERMLIRPASFWAERAIEMLPGKRAVDVDATARTVVTNDGSVFHYGALIWATGGRARKLQSNGSELAGIHSVRSRADVDGLERELAFTTSVVVIGGGYVGLEAAAVLTKMGKRVTIVEALDRVLARVAGETLSRFYEAEHRAHGVDVRLGVFARALHGVRGRVSSVEVSRGEVIEAQMVIVGIGIDPAVEPLLAAGAAGGNGVSVDELGRTSLPDVYAIGDCALHQNPYVPGPPTRLECVQHAHDSAAALARTLTGDPTPYNAVPWFWSNQYDLRLQTVGVAAGHDIEVVRGDLASRAFSVIYLKERRVIALECVNATRDFVQGKALVASRAQIPVEILADPSAPLKDLVAS